MSRKRAYFLVAAACALPRLAVLALEREAILASYVDKSDVFARTLIDDGTFGFIPGEPSAYTQPLYGWFLAGLYWPFGRSWLAVGIAQIVVAVLTALVVFAIGTRLRSPAVGLIAATIATLHPYVVWHDVHLNREVVDGLALACQHQKARHRGDDDDDDGCRRSLHLASTFDGRHVGGTVRGRLLPR